MFIAGVGTIAVLVGTVLVWEWGIYTPLALGTALAFAAIPVGAAIGGHELAHYFVADEYCRFNEVHFSAFVSTTGLTLLSLGVILLFITLEAFGGVSVPKWMLLLAVASPGAVVVKGRSRRPACKDEAALAGSLFNFAFGALLLVGMLDSQLFLPTPDWGIMRASLHLTAGLSLYLAFLNSLPIGSFDGRKVIAAREPVTLVLWAVTLGGSAWLLYSSIW